MWPGLDSRTRRHKWVEFVGSLLCSERFFSGYSGFLSPQKLKSDLICVVLWCVVLCCVVLCCVVLCCVVLCCVVLCCVVLCCVELS